MNLQFRIEGLPRARPIVSRAAARGFRPPRKRNVAEWAHEERRVAAESGSPFPGRWSNVAPYLDEVMEVLSPSHPARRVTFRGSAQVAKSEAGLNLIGHVIQDAPAPILVVLPTTDEVTKYVDIKLEPMISATPGLREKVADSKSRDEDGSTKKRKKFPGGFLQLTHASSSSGLQMISVRYVILEEPSEYERDAGDRGDPIKLAIKRTEAWSGREKIYIPGTPGISGECVLTASFEAGDQRHLYVPCPICGMRQRLLWARFEKLSPATTAYVCAANGCVIEPRHKTWMIQQTREGWIKCYPGEDEPPPFFAEEDLVKYRARPSGDREPSFTIWAAFSPTKAWSDIVREHGEIRTPADEKVFANQVLGEDYAPKFDAPDQEKLSEAAKKAGHAFRTVPNRALILTGAADVQGDRLEWSVTAFDETACSWDIDRGVIEGDPTDTRVWRQLDTVLARKWKRADGRAFGLDAFAVDTGYLSQRVYAWARRHAASGKVYAIKGQPGWMQLPIGTPVRADVDHDGKKIGEVSLYPLGTWDLKAELYAGIAKLIAGPDKETGLYPEGTCFYSDACDRNYFDQLTAEHVVPVKDRRTGREIRVWQQISGRPNEQHDMAVYSRALYRHLTNRLRLEEWMALIADRRPAEPAAQASFEAMWSPPLEIGGSAEVEPGSDEAEPPAEPAARGEHGYDTAEDWLGGRGRDWF